MNHRRFVRGFLPPEDPLIAFPDHSPYSMLDQIGRELPDLLEDKQFRHYAKELKIPCWSESNLQDEAQMHLYYVRVGFLASGFINQIGQEPEQRLPENIARPLVEVTRLLKKLPILSYDGYALYNWKRIDAEGPIALGNIDTIQNFVHLFDEHWFILVHVEIEALAADLLSVIHEILSSTLSIQESRLNQILARIAHVVRQQTVVLKRIPEHMDPAKYHRTFRKYIRFFENVTYEGVQQAPIHYRGETGAQSSIMPALISLLKIQHQPTDLTDHLDELRQYMPFEHRVLLEEIEKIPDQLWDRVDPKMFNDVLEAIAEFREVHFNWAQEYISQRESDPRGTGGTPYMKWLKQLIDETRACKKTV